MKYYKNANNEVYAYAADGSQDAYIPSSSVSITIAEADAIRFPILPQSVPQTVSAAQAKIALFNAGLLTQVETIMADPATPVPMVISWNSAYNFDRSSPTLAALATQLGLTSTQLDDLFIAADKVIA
jgi:hypothetical protein